MNSNPVSVSAPLTFSFVSSSLRVILRDGEPWFVAADVCAALDHSNVTQALKRLDDDEQALISNEGIHRGSDQVNVVNESGLYSLILGSRKPEAKKFKKWVTSEVLPAIRKTGRYEAPAAVPEAEYITANDLANLSRLVHLISDGHLYARAWSFSVWKALRRVTGTRSPERFEVRHLPVLAAEIERIYTATTLMYEAGRRAEADLLRRVFREGEGASAVVAELEARILRQGVEDAAQLKEVLDPWCRRDIGALRNRSKALLGPEHYPHGPERSPVTPIG